MTNYNEEAEGGRGRVILAAIILALQIIILLWLLLFARDRFARAGQEPQATAAPTAVADTGASTAVPEAGDEANATADTATADTATADAATADAAIASTAAANAAVTTDAATAAAQPTEMAMSAADAGVLAPDDVGVNAGSLSGLVAPDWLAQLVDGTGPDAAADTPGVPPHLLLTFPDAEQPELELATPDAIDLSQPQVRIVPIAALLAWLQARGDDAGQDALEDLESMLADPPPADEASAPATPLLSDLSPLGAARLVFEDFAGGHGVGYIAHMSGDAATAVTDDAGLTYVYQGLTDDGKHYVFMSWPIAADIPATADAAAAETALAADPDAYYQTVATEVDEATDAAFSPPATWLRRLIASLAVGRTAVAALAQTTPEATVVAEPAAVPGAPAGAGGIVWHWTSSRGGDGDETAVANPPDYTLVFWPGGGFSFVADCNVGRGDYTVAADGTVSLLPGAMTRAACPPGSQADEFLQTLAATQALAFDESGDMILTLADGREAVFANAGPADTEAAAESEAQPDAADAGFTGLNLQWPGFTDAAGNAVSVDNPEDYTLALLPDGTFTFRADCNIGSGTYTYADDGTLTLLPGAMTRVACPADSQSDVFLGFLSAVNGVTVADDGAVTMTTADGGSAIFVNVGPVTDEAAAPEGETAAPGDLLNIAWQWLSLSDADGNETGVPDPALYTVALLDDGTYTFVADCNRGAGGYTLDGPSLTLAPGPMTLAACDADSLSDRFVDVLGRVQSYAFDGDNLLLTLDDGRVATLGNGGPFAATDAGSGPVDATGQPSAAPLAGVTWRWATFRDAKQDYAVPATTDYTLVFNDDGTVNVVADCNVANGSYTVNSDGTLTIAVLATTLAACTAGSLSDSFLEYLNQAGPFEVDEAGALIIELMADGGTMTFVAAP